MPQTATEFILTAIPVITILLGLMFLIVPRRILRFMGLEARTGHLSSSGEARAAFASFLIAPGLACLLLQDPLVQQPGLTNILALGWFISAAGRFLQLFLDNGRRKRVWFRFFLALILGLLGWHYGPNLSFAWDQNDIQVWPAMVAILTLVYGLIAFVTPGRFLKAHGLVPRPKQPFAKGAARGTPAGFPIAVASVALFASLPVASLFAVLVMGAAWALSALGRLIAVFVDKRNRRRDFARIAAEATFAFLSLSVFL